MSWRWGNTKAIWVTLDCKATAPPVSRWEPSRGFQRLAVPEVHALTAPLCSCHQWPPLWRGVWNKRQRDGAETHHATTFTSERKRSCLMTAFIWTVHMTIKTIVSLLEADGTTMLVNGMCQMTWTETCSKIGGQRMPVAKTSSSLSKHERGRA